MKALITELLYPTFIPELFILTIMLLWEDLFLFVGHYFVGITEPPLPPRFGFKATAKVLLLLALIVGLPFGGLRAGMFLPTPLRFLLGWLTWFMIVVNIPLVIGQAGIMLGMLFTTKLEVSGMQRKKTSLKWLVWVRAGLFVGTLLFLCVTSLLYIRSSMTSQPALYAAIVGALGTIATFIQLVPLVFPTRSQENPTLSERAEDSQRESEFQLYYDKMNDLLLKHNLLKSAEHDEVRNMARIRTRTILPRLDGVRKGHVLRFLYEAGLINQPPIIDLQGADFSNVVVDADLRGAVLAGADLSHAHLGSANLEGADLSDTNLKEAHLQAARLTEVNLMHATLADTNLEEARLERANLSQAQILNTNMTLVHMAGANLSRAMLTSTSLRSSDLTNADLSNAFLGSMGNGKGQSDLSGAYLRHTNLSNASLIEVSLKGAILCNANLRGANLQGAKLENAVLSAASVSTEQLKKAATLVGAIMPGEACPGEASLSGEALHTYLVAKALTLIEPNVR